MIFSMSLLTLFGAASLTDLVAGELKLAVPSGWVVVQNPALLLELHVGKDGSRGLLQLSRLSDDAVATLAQRELGEVAAFFGEWSNKHGQNWGHPTSSKSAACALGRLGTATFAGGEFPAMSVWYTISNRAAYMWTWLGPDPKARELDDAMTVVMGARELHEAPRKTLPPHAR